MRATIDQYLWWNNRHEIEVDPDEAEDLTDDQLNCQLEQQFPLGELA